MAYNRDLSLRDHINEGWLASTDADGNRMSYDDYVKDYLWSNGLPADTDINNSSASFKTDDDLHRNFTVTNNDTGQTLKSQNWVGGDEGWTKSMLTAIAMWAGGYGLGAAAAGAGAAGAGAAAGEAGASGAAAGGAAGAGAAEAGAGIGVLGSGETGLTALGSSWSPSALGLTEAITPAISAGDLASLGALGEAGAGVGAAGGAAASGDGLTALGSEWSPQSLGLTGDVGATTPTVESIGAVPSGGNVSWADDLFQQYADEALNSSGNYYNQSDLGQWLTDVGNQADAGGGSWLDYIKSAADQSGLSGAGTSGSNSAANSIIKGLLGGSSTGTGTSANLGTLLGGLLGAASSQSGTTTSTKAPWEEAQPYLKGLLGDADTMRQNLAANPYTAQQTNAYNQAYAGLDQSRAALPAMQSWATNAMQTQSKTPSYDQLFSQVKPR